VLGNRVPTPEFPCQACERNRLIPTVIWNLLTSASRVISMKCIVLTVFLSAATIAIAQRGVDTAVDDVPNGWIIAPSRAENSELWHCAVYGDSWVVEKDKSDAIKITDWNSFLQHTRSHIPPNLKLSEETKGRHSVLQTSDGWLIGSDAGEFGGGLWWFSRDGGETRKLLSENVKAIYETPKGIIVLTGLAHLSLNDGGVYTFSATQDEVKIKWLVPIGRSPEASSLDGNGNILIATTDSVLRLTFDGKIETLYEPKETLVYPTSVEVDRTGTISVGMRFFILQLKPNQSGLYVGHWLMRDKCTKTKLSKYICTCVGR